jgi:hypothetical protein
MKPEAFATPLADSTASVITGGNAIPLLGPVLPRMAYRPSLVLEELEMILKAGK